MRDERVVGEFPRLRVLAEPMLAYRGGFNSIAGPNGFNGLNGYQPVLPRIEPAQGVGTSQLSSKIEAQPLSLPSRWEL